MYKHFSLGSFDLCVNISNLGVILLFQTKQRGYELGYSKDFGLSFERKIY